MPDGDMLADYAISALSAGIVKPECNGFLNICQRLTLIWGANVPKALTLCRKIGYKVGLII
jgi:hypothetical protein